MFKIQQNNIDKGNLRIDVTSEDGRPIEGATADISYTGDPEEIIEEVKTDKNGQSSVVDLPAPPIEYSEQPGVEQPYSEYSLIIRAPGYSTVSINGTNIFSGQLSIQNIRLEPRPSNPQGSVIIIGPNTLYGNYPAKIPESEVKPVTNTGEIVLNKVVVPETIIVHNGSPSNSSAKNYYVPYIDYIKNVACSEIYPTWPEATIIANVIAINSFTLNRVYTEWYRNKGYDFTITSNTAYDQKWIYGRDIFDSISLIVDEIFTDYLSKPNIKQPLLTQYCDGQRTTCSGLSQWGSKYLGDDNYTASQILRTYYGQNTYINTAEEVSGIPASWPGYTLEVGSTGNDVSTIQDELTSIRQTYSNIPAISVDGIYGERTADAVSAFQKIFDLPVTGTVDYKTWYKISQLYVALEKLAEL